MRNINLLICGIDEAGRGSVLGPLVIAGINIKNSEIKKLEEIGVRDSKALTRKKRGFLFDKILDITEFVCIYKIDCKTIDENVYQRKLNKLEGGIMSTIIKYLEADIAYVDSCDVNINRYTNYLKSNLDLNNNTSIIAMHKADRMNPAVSAASIIAKVTRDREIQILEENFQNIGSGYPSDKKTMYFIHNWIKEYKEFPNFVRKSWKPVREIICKQSKIYDFV
ncbi:MAG: ribonuclease HII [Nitrososphaeraceae archaeon]|nr:ribonuclease HII [Nitrososphaeraceae archaeon]